jgi:uncharacterized repeat protein (TIGR01451 family)
MNLGILKKSNLDKPILVERRKSARPVKNFGATKRFMKTVLTTFMILGSLLVLTPGALAEPESAPAWPASIPWQDYEIAGEPVRDYEDKPYENDPTHGIANVQPKAVDIASGVDATGGGPENNPGNFTSVQWYYLDDNGDTSGFSNIDDDWLFLRMRVADDPTHGGKFYYKAYHWDILVDTDGDVWSEFVVDLNGGDGVYKFGTVGTYYNDDENYVYNPATDMIWSAEASSASNDYTRAVAIDYGPGYVGLTQYWIEYRIPVTGFKDNDGNQLLVQDTNFRLFFSTSASLTNPLQKDWMAEYVFAGPANITVAKAAAESYADPGDVIHYTIYYNNTGESNSGIVTINDTIPDNTQFLESSIPYNSSSGNTYTWVLDNVPVGNHSLYLNVTVDAYVDDGTELTNYVHLDYTDSGGSPLPGSEDSVTTIVTAPSFSFKKSVDKTSVYPGDDLHYELEVKNTGTGTAAKVWVNDTIPTGTTFKDCSPAYYSKNGNDLVWYFTDFGQETKTIYLNVTVKTSLGDGDDLNNTALVLFTDANENQYPKIYDWADSTSTTPIITVDKTAKQTTADPGDIIEYTIKYSNIGTGNAADIWINDTIPGYTTFYSATPSYTSVSGNVYTWHFTNVAPGNYQITLKLKVDVGTPDGTILSNGVTVDYKSPTGVEYPPVDDTENVTVTAPIMTIEKAADVSTADPGDVITYTITYKNTGTGIAGNVWVNDTIPADTTYVSSTPAYTSVSGDTYTWHFTNVGTGTYYITLKVSVDVGTPDQTVLTNNVTLDYTDANGNQPYAQQWDTATTTGTAPIMVISKSVNKNTADPGDELVYIITYANSGAGVAKDVWVKDTIPADTTYVSSTPAYTSVSGDTYTWHFTNVATGTYYITLKVNVDVGTSDQAVLTNNVTLDYTDANGNQPYAQQWDTATTTATAPVMTIEKDVDVANADPGDTLTYTITYKNTGTGAAGHVWVNDTIDPDTTYVSSTPTYTSVSGDTYTWHFTNVAPGTYYITLKVTVDVNTGDGVKLKNDVSLDYTDANGNQPYQIQWDTAMTTVTAPVMTIAKSADSTTADPGDVITYTITYKNLGTGNSKDVWVKDTIPADTTYVSSNPAYTSVSGDTYTWHFTNVAPGTYYIVLKVKVDIATGDQTVLTNNVTLDYTDANGNQPYAQQWDTATTTVTAPIMSIDKSVDVATADPGDEMVYTITYKNTGAGVAKDVWVKDTIPADTTYVSSTPAYTSVSGDTYTWHFTNVITGTYYITLKVKVDVGTADQTVMVNNATLDYTDANGNQPYAQQWDTATTTVTAPVMSIEKVVDVGYADPSDTLTYTITYKNTGTGVAASVWVKDTIPADTTYVSSTPAYTSVSGDTYTWQFPNVGTGTYYITIKVTVDIATPDQTKMTNNATLDYTDANGNQPYAQQWDTATTFVTAPVMSIDKTVDVANADPGDIITYTLDYKNTGTGNAANVYIKDTIPSDTSYVSSTPAYTSVSGNTYTWHFTNVAPGNYSIELKVQVKVGTADQAVMDNYVTLDYSDANDNYYPQLNDTATTTATAPIMSIEKSVDVAFADPGDEITYTITYKNIGTGAAGHVWVNDTIPADTTYVSSAPAYTSVSGDTYTWHFTNVPTGTNYITLKVKVDVGTPDQAVLTNNVTLDYTDANGNQPYPQQWDTTTSTATAPVMSIDKSVDVATADPGDEVTYTITYKNTGTGVAGTVWVEDTIPADTTFVSSTPTYTSVSGDTYTWQFTNVGAGTYYITITVKVNAGTADQTPLINNATLDHTDANGNQPYAQQWDTATTTVTAPVMDLDKNTGNVLVNTFILADFKLRVAGEKWHDVRLTLYNDNQSVAVASVTRFPGDPDDQSVTIYDVKINPISGMFKAKLEYTPFDDVVNGQIWGADPCWLTLIFEDDSSVRLHHTFNVRHNETWNWTIDDFAPYIAKAPITYEILAPYSITYNNTGTGDAGDVWVHDTIPEGTLFVYASPNYTSVSGDTYTWHFTNVSTGTYYIYIMVAKIVSYSPDETDIILINNATMDYTDANGNPYGTKTAQATVNITLPLMGIIKKVEPNKGKFGDYIEVKLDVYTQVNNATVMDYIPIELNYTGNALDDDMDGLVDEEANDGIDNDGDGLIDEDLGNFMLDGAPVSGGLSLSGNNLIFSNLPLGIHVITFDLIIVENTSNKHDVTNMAQIIYNGLVQDKDTADITILAFNNAPNAIMRGPKAGGSYEDVPISFGGDDSYDTESSINYHWDFGDGEFSNEINPTHTYLDPGRYTVTLTVDDGWGLIDFTKIYLDVLISVPEAHIMNPHNSEFSPGEMINFEGGADYIGDYANLEYEWQFGDGVSAFGSTSEYSYPIAGTYEVTLIVRDHDGDYDQTTIIISIKSEEPQVQLPLDEEPPEEVIPTTPAPPAPEEPDEIPTTPVEQPKTGLKKVEPTQHPIPDLLNIIPDTGGELSEQIFTEALEIIIGGSFISATFIMEVVLPPGSKPGEDNESGEPEVEDNDSEE